MSNVFFVINQHLLDGSAHALYCFRHCWWLAKTRPAATVHLIFPGSVTPAELKAQFGFPELPNFKVTGLRSVRKAKHGKGITLNFVFYWAACAFVKRTCRPGDYLFSASFPKLFDFLTRQTALRSKLQFVYEVHQLAVLDHGQVTAKAEYEFCVLAKADLLITNSQPLADTARQHGVLVKSFNAGLAASFSPDQFPAPQRDQPVSSIGYLGSLYREQGIPWLVENWSAIRNGKDLTLHIVGGSPADVEKLQHLSTKTGAISKIRFHGAVSPSRLPAVLPGIDALIIPALAEGRMPFVAITKAYDFLGMNRPVLASRLPSITEVMRPGVDAIFFEPADVPSLRRAIDRLEEEGLAESLCRNAAVRAAELSWEPRARRLWQLLDSSFAADAKAG